MRVTLQPGAWVDPSKMLEVIRDAGFTPVPENVHLTATGALGSRDGRLVLVLDRMLAPRELTCVAGRSAGSSETELREKVGRTLLIRGRWLAQGAGALEVEAVDPATDPVK